MRIDLQPVATNIYAAAKQSTPHNIAIVEQVGAQQCFAFIHPSLESRSAGRGAIDFVRGLLLLEREWQALTSEWMENSEPKDKSSVARPCHGSASHPARDRSASLEASWPVTSDVTRLILYSISWQSDDIVAVGGPL